MTVGDNFKKSRLQQLFSWYQDQMENAASFSVGGIKAGEARRRHVSPKIQKKEIVTN